MGGGVVAGKAMRHLAVRRVRGFPALHQKDTLFS